MIPFSKYSGCGNDFIIVDNRQSIFPKNNGQLVKNLCQRRVGIGADGVILIENCHNADYRVRIFNADGSEAEMCGNGMRCIGKFLIEKVVKKDSFLIETPQKDVSVKIDGEIVCVGMGNPSDVQWEMEISTGENSYSISYLDTGVPHAVLFVEDLETVDLLNLGPKFRHHPTFQPRGTNFNIAKLIDNEVSLRTYERGVEEETLACGTGATAAALTAAVKYQLPSPIHVRTLSGDTLKIGFDKIQSIPCNVTMSGPAKCIYHGVVAI